MVRVVGVRFKKAGKVYYFDPVEYPVAVGAKVVVETARGVEYGEVAVGPKDVAEDQVVQPLKPVIRPGNEKDAVVAAENKRKEKEAFSVAQKKIEAHTLEMTLVDVEYTFDGSKIIFYFTAEGRVDFRDLVRDLASVFRTRIEMRQIGVRDEAKLLGGIGPCGRVLCCTSFLGDFAPVSIRMAKDQNLSLNPSKISGLCGRLMCCLRYEQETYEAAKKDPTLAPGYVPVAILAEENVPNLDELEDRPRPAIGVKRHNESGMSARIAQAAGLVDRPQRREERPQGTERPQGLPRPLAAPGKAQPQGQHQGRRDGGPRREGEGSRPQPAQNQSRSGQPQQHQGKGKPQGQSQAQGGERERQPGQQPRQKGPQRPPQAQQHPKQGQRPQGERPQGERQREERAEGNRPNKHRHHRGHRPKGDRPQGGDKPQGGNPQA